MDLASLRSGEFLERVGCHASCFPWPSHNIRNQSPCLIGWLPSPKGPLPPGHQSFASSVLRRRIAESCVNLSARHTTRTPLLLRLAPERSDQTRPRRPRHPARSPHRSTGEGRKESRCPARRASRLLANLSAKHTTNLSARHTTKESALHLSAFNGFTAG